MIEETLKWAHFPFRPDVTEKDGAILGFDRDKQISLCAIQLENLRHFLGKDWWTLNDTDVVPSSGRAEEKNLAKGLIRLCSESVDYYATVDFVTEGALRELESLRLMHPTQKSLKGHLQRWDKLTHEHMTPCEVVFREITERRDGSNEGPLAPLLEQLSYRALVAGTKQKGTLQGPTSESDELDGRFQALWSKPKDIASLEELRLAGIPLAYYSLLRYDASGLYSGLIPLNARARRLKADYTDFKLALKRPKSFGDS